MVVFLNPLTGYDTERYGVALSPPGVTTDIAWGNYTVIGKYGTRIIKASGTRVRLTLKGYIEAGHTGTLNNVTISLASNTAGANPYDSDTTPTAVTFAGSASVALVRDSIKVSDVITFTLDGSRAVLIGYNLAANAYVSITSRLSTSDYVMYRKSGVAEADDATKSTGYTASAHSPFLFKLECLS